jgi:hypothetical protein
MKTEVQQVARPERPRCGQGLCSCLTSGALVVVSALYSNVSSPNSFAWPSSPLR